MSAVQLQNLGMIGGTFSTENARAIAADVGLAPTLPDIQLPEIDASPDDMVFAQLAHKLNCAAWEWGWQAHQQRRASPQKVASLAEKVSAQCANLLATLRGPDGEIQECLGAGALWAAAHQTDEGSGRLAVASAIANIEDLQRWAVAVSARRAGGARGGAARTGKNADQAFHGLLGELGGVYLLFWLRAPRCSSDPYKGGQPGGPFFRFVSATLCELDIPRTDQAIATAIKRSPTLKAMRRMIEANEVRDALQKMGEIK